MSQLGAAVLPQLALFGAAICYAVTALISRKYPYEKPLQMAAASVLIGAFGITIICLMAGQLSGLENASWRSWAALTYLGLGPTALAACLLYTSPSPRDKRQSRMPSSA